MGSHEIHKPLMIPHMIYCRFLCLGIHGKWQKVHVTRFLSPTGHRPQGKGDHPDSHEHAGSEDEEEPGPSPEEPDGGVAPEPV